VKIFRSVKAKRRKSNWRKIRAGHTILTLALQLA